MTAAQPPDSVQPFISPSMREAMIGAVIFSVLSLLFMKEQSWKLAVSAIATGLSLAYFGTAPLAAALRLGTDYYGVIGCGFGFLGLTLLGIIAKVVQMLRDDPIGTAQRFLPFLGKRGADQ